jgi:hypothetical protein
VGIGNVLVHCGGRLGATVTLGVIEISGGDGVFTESAPEGYSAIDPSGGVIAHNLIVVAAGHVLPGQEVLTFRLNPATEWAHYPFASSQESATSGVALHASGTFRLGMGGAAKSR